MAPKQNFINMGYIYTMTYGSIRQRELMKKKIKKITYFDAAIFADHAKIKR